MGAPKPILGYPSRTAAVMHMRAGGMRSPAIAAALGISTAAVITLEHQCLWTKQARARRDKLQATQRCVRIPMDIIDRIAPHAAARGITPNECVRRLLDEVLDSGLIDAILDDG